VLLDFASRSWEPSRCPGPAPLATGCPGPRLTSPPPTRASPQVITSPFTWLEQYTDKSKWVGGTECAGAPLRCADALKETLGSMGYDVCEVGAAPRPPPAA